MKNKFQYSIPGVYMFFFLALLNVPFELKAEESNFGLSYNSENSLRITAITDFVPLQQFIVTGTITDENGFPIAGVNVRGKRHFQWCYLRF